MPVDGDQNVILLLDLDAVQTNVPLGACDDSMCIDRFDTKSMKALSRL